MNLLRVRFWRWKLVGIIGQKFVFKGKARTMLVLNLGSILEVSPSQYCEICALNPDLKIERDAQGRIIVMPPTGGWSGNRNIRISQRLATWADADGTGIAFDSSTEFLLPNGAYRSPDASWITFERWDRLTLEQQESFPPIAPDFVIELRSKTDSLKQLQEKMQEYMDNEVRLGWLIDPKEKNVEVYRLGKQVEILRSPTSLSGENVLAGFVLSLEKIF